MEILFLVLWRMRQQIEFQKSRSVVQALMSQQGSEGKAIEKAFDDLRESFFPFEKRQKSVEISELKKAMQQELGRGALRVTPMVDLTKVKMQQKLSQGQEALSQKAELLRSGRLQPLGATDAIQEARHRVRKQAAASLIQKEFAQTPAQPTTS